MMHAVPAAAAIDRSSRRRPSRGATLDMVNGAAPAALLRDLCDAMMVIGHDGARVHAELSMTFDLHERLRAWWENEPEPPALHLVA